MGLVLREKYRRAIASPSKYRGLIRRLLHELRFQGQRETSIRDCALQFLFRREAYLSLRFPTLGVAHEAIRFSAIGLTGVLGAAVQGMPKDFVEVRESAEALFKLHDLEKQFPHYGEVPAPGTSKICSTDGGEVDRRGSANWGVCSGGGEILDAHVNATGNMAARYFKKYVKPAGGGVPGPPVSPPATP